MGFVYREGILYQLAPGDLAITDNLRVLVGRTAFTNTSDGSRHLQICFADRDGLYSRLATLNRY